MFSLKYERFLSLKIKSFILTILVVMTASQVICSSSYGNKSSGSQIDLLKQAIVPFNQFNDSDVLIHRAAQVPLVLIGDSTHGTHEFYQERINLSKRLIEEKNFKLIALEGDWPNVYILNKYIQSNSPLTAEQALDASNPFAAWLWGNREMLGFIQWLKDYNERLAPGEQKVSLYGLDIFSFKQSMNLVVEYLSFFSLRAAQQAQQRYQCFSKFNYDLHRYGRTVSQNPMLSCEQAVLQQYQDFSQCRIPCPEYYSFIDREAWFYAMQNARVMKNIEKSLRLNYVSGEESTIWNQRDRHMMETLIAVLEHLQQPKTIIWAHNSHLGDARATEMVALKQLNLGQLLRQYFEQQVFSIGMLTYSGTVMAADDWNLPPRKKVLLPAHPESNEALFHRLNIPRFLLFLHQTPNLTSFLNKTRLQRHVGAVYRPQDEMKSHYSYTHLASQFDAVIYIDETTEITPLN